MKNILADQLEIWGIESDTVIFADGSFGIGFKVKSLDPSCWSADQSNSHSEATKQFLNGLPTGLDVQFIKDIRPGNIEKINRHGKLDETTNPLVNELTKIRIDKFEKLDSNGFLPAHESLIFIRKLPIKDLKGYFSFFSLKKNFQSISEQNLQEELRACDKLKSKILEGLGSLGIEPRSLSGEDLLSLIYDQWNPSRKIRLGNVDPDCVRSSLLFSDVGIESQGFAIGDCHHRVLSLKILPEVTYSTMSSKLSELPFNSRVSVSINVPDQQKELDELQTQRRIAFSMVAGKQTGVSDLESAAKLKDLESLLEKMVSEGEKVFKMSLQVILKAKSKDELDSRVNQTLALFREMGSSEVFQETLASFDIFTATSIPNARCPERRKKIKTSNLCDLIPIYGPWQGHDEAKILLRSRNGSLITFDPFASSLTNSNQIISGGSGSGKSYLVNLLMMQMMKHDPKVFIIDIGGSYKKICENLGGQYIPLGVESNISINPFDIKIGESKPSSEKIKFLLSLIEIMTKEDENHHIGKLERSEIEDCIQRLFDEKQNPKISDLRNRLVNHSDPTVSRLGRILSSWCGQTHYGKFVDRVSTIELKSPIVCFDLKGMDSFPDLQAAFLFMITDFVWREVQENRYKPKFLILDECWKLIESDSASVFIGEVYRTFRKYLASVIGITQNIDDFAKSKIANAILPNSSIKWILRQKGANFDRLGDVLALNQNEIDLISSLTQERGVYSEAFLMAEDDRSVVSVEATPIEYWLATTDARDLKKIEEENENSKNKNQFEILKELAIKYPRGVAAS